MSEPKPLNPTEQDALVKQIGLTLMRAAPEGWQHVIADYRATGRYFELSAEVRSADGSAQGWAPPQEVSALFSRLRAGMHREGRGSWSNARYQLDQPASYNLDFDRTEPKWQNPPPQQAYVDEMRFFPRVEENVPEWLRKWLPAPQPPAAPQAPRGFRTARVFDGAGSDGRPSVNRPPVPDHEREALLGYLDRAPVAVAGRGFDADVLDKDAPSVVPVAFQTDGHWIWPAAVGYYLRAYGIPPETELVERARAAEFRSPDLSEDVRVAAAANLGAPTAPRGTPLPAPAVVVAAAPQKAEEFSPFGEDRTTQPYDPHATVAAPLPVLDPEDDLRSSSPTPDHPELRYEPDHRPAEPAPSRQDQATEFQPKPDFGDENFFPGDGDKPGFQPTADFYPEDGRRSSSSTPDHPEVHYEPDHRPAEAAPDFYPEGGPAPVPQPPVQSGSASERTASAQSGPVAESDANFFGAPEQVTEEQFFPEDGRRPSSPTPDDPAPYHVPAPEQFFPEDGAQRPRLTSPSGVDAQPEPVSPSGPEFQPEARPRPDFGGESSFFPEEGRRPSSSTPDEPTLYQEPAPEQFFPEDGAQQPSSSPPSGVDTTQESGPEFQPEPHPRSDFGGDGSNFYPEEGAKPASDTDENFFPEEGRRPSSSTPDEPTLYQEPAPEQFFPEDGAQRPSLTPPSGLDGLDGLDAPAKPVFRSEPEAHPRSDFGGDGSFYPEDGPRPEPTAPEQFFPEDGVRQRGQDAPVEPESPSPAEFRSESKLPEGFGGDSTFFPGGVKPDLPSATEEHFFPTASAPVEQRPREDAEFQPDFRTETPKSESTYDPDSNFFPVEGDSATTGFQPTQDFYPESASRPEPDATVFQPKPDFEAETEEPELLRAEPGPGFQPADDFDAQPVFRTDVDHGFRAEPEPRPAEQLVEPRPEPMPVDEPNVEDTANLVDLVDLRPAAVPETEEVLEFDQRQFDAAQDGPPYRVQFDFDTEPTPPRDDRYRRESYVEGMDLFAPNRYESAGVEQDTAAWSPFGAAQQPSTDALPVEPKPEPLPIEEPVVEQSALVEADLVDVVPKFEVEADPRHADVTTRFEVDQETQFDIEPVAVEPPPVEPEVPRQVTPEEERELSGVRRALDDLDVPPAAYRIGEPVERTWNLRTEGSSWVVAWYDNGPKSPSRFDRLEDAASYLIGKLVLTGRRAPRRQPPPPQMRPPQGLLPQGGPQGAPLGVPQGPPQNGVNGFRDGRPMPPPQAVQVAPQPRPEPLPRVEPPRPEPLPRVEMPRPEPLPRAEMPRPEPLPRVEPPRPEPISTKPVRVDAPRQEPAQQQTDTGGKRGWPIKPMNGEPPLTLFRHKKMIELPVGFEVDRFGEPGGNLVYAAGTPFEERSLVPSWINRAYRVYRLRRPVEVLTGVAVPWFEQPGGGTAYLFPSSVDEMVADGALVEVSHQEAQN